LRLDGYHAAAEAKKDLHVAADIGAYVKNEVPGFHELSVERRDLFIFRGPIDDTLATRAVRK
jgi:hypothetical protein